MSTPVGTDQAADPVVLFKTHVRAVGGHERCSLEVAGGTVAPPRATVGIRLADAEVAAVIGEEPGSVVTATASGDGMVDAARGAIRHAVGRDEVSLVSFQVTAVSGGIDALGEVTVTVEVEDQQRCTGRGVSTDIIEASACADVDALNRSRRLVQRSPEFKP